jgi:hypothetical protein
MRVSRFAAVLGVAAMAACSVVNSVDDPVPANNDTGAGGATPVGCPDGFEVCGGACVRTDNDPANCGACGTACAENQVCGLSQCLTSCPEDMTGCDGSCVDLQTDPMHCGTCEGACAAGDNAHATCTAGQCGVECDAGFASCDIDPTDCEINVDSDPANCGECNKGCIARANAAPSCAAGVCGLGDCNAGFVDCDGFEETGCEIDTMSDEDNCNNCGMACPNTQFCVAGACAPLYESVQTNVPETELTSNGWTLCHTSTYNSSGTTLASILAACPGARLALACRDTGSPTLRVLATGDRTVVTTDCAAGATGCGSLASTCTTESHGVGWYFHDAWSWGFAPAGEVVNRCSCDTQNPDSEDRICWHTGGGNLNGGYRCGSDTSSNGERRIYQAN